MSTDQEILELVQSLRHSDELATSYDKVLPALATVSEAGLAKVGQRLTGLDLAAVAEHHRSIPTVRVAVLGSSTLAPVVAPLTGALAFRGFAPRVTTGSYGQYIPELLMPGADVFGDGADAVLVLLDEQEVFRRIPVPWTVDAAEEAFDAFADELTAAIQGFRAHSSTPVILSTIVASARRGAQLVDVWSRARLGIAWRRLNTRLLELAADIPGLVVLDADPLAAAAEGAVADPRLAAYAQIRHSEVFLRELAREVAAVVAAQQGRTSKVLVLDLDGTTWGETLAEVGSTGLVSGEGPVGECFSAFQQAARQLSAQGVLLAIASKNDDGEVREVLRTNDRVAFTEDDFVAIAANWDPKPANIAAMADTLSLGLDSFVFIDDNPSEVGAVRTALPTVRVIGVDHTEPALHVGALLRHGYFTSLRITGEDAERTSRYRAEAKRATVRAAAGSIEDYLRELGTEVLIAPVGEDDIARVSQITLRTNQFNMTTLRMDEAAVREFTAAGGIATTVRCTDRFGDHGLIGVLFAEPGETSWHITNFAMSCRVLGRGVEHAAIGWVLDQAKRAGADHVTARFVPSPKNARSAQLYPDLGFAPSTGADGAVDYRRELAELPVPPAHVAVRVPAEL